MTQIFHPSSGQSSPGVSEKRAFTGLALSNRQVSNSQVSQKIKNFFRINSDKQDHKNVHRNSDTSDEKTRTKSDKSSFRQSRFLPHLGRNRSTTVASEGNPLEDSALSPTALANPYFAHQGPPALRHHNDSSVPPSPPDTPQIGAKKDVEAVSGANDQAVTAGKEELARKLRRVASAPNAQNLFAKAIGKNTTDDRPSTADLGKEPLIQHGNASAVSMVEPETANGTLLPVPPANGIPTPGQIRNAVAFRRTYSSNSIKVRNVEVGPGSFDKIKLIGKGDVGKVYLVREKKSTRLYAMKGSSIVDG